MTNDIAFMKSQASRFFAFAIDTGDLNYQPQQI